jgi:hypothetical protein
LINGITSHWVARIGNCCLTPSDWFRLKNDSSGVPVYAFNDPRNEASTEYAPRGGGNMLNRFFPASFIHSWDLGANENWFGATQLRATELASCL